MDMRKLVIGIMGAGEIASAVAWRLFMAHFRKIFMTELPAPLAVRREVSYCESLFGGRKTVEGLEGVRAEGPEEVLRVWEDGKIAVIPDPQWQSLKTIKPQVLIDALLAKKNLGTHKEDAPLVIGLGPGFEAGRDVDFVIETNRGHHLGRIFTKGAAEPNTGVPGSIEGHTGDRVLRAPSAGEFLSSRTIGDIVEAGEVIGTVAGNSVHAQIGGALRGLIRSPAQVSEGLKIGDIDPRGIVDYCYTISEKARAISGSVLEVILRVYHGRMDF
jgi:xanthine dehydrogenase accessory factor